MNGTAYVWQQNGLLQTMLKPFQSLPIGSLSTFDSVPLQGKKCPNLVVNLCERGIFLIFLYLFLFPVAGVHGGF